MRHPTLNRCILISALVFAALARGRCGPLASWRVYNVSDGFPASTFSSVTVAESGAVLAVGSASSNFCLFDGYEAKTLPLPKDAARVYQSPAGEIWTCSAQGLWMLKENEWKLFPVAELAATPATQIWLCPVRLNEVLCLSPEKLIECSVENPGNVRVQTVRSSAQANIGKFTGMAMGVEDELWIAGERGVARLSGPRRSLGVSSQWREFVPPESLHF